jgi:hypothetical protein
MTLKIELYILTIVLSCFILKALQLLVQLKLLVQKFSTVAIKISLVLNLAFYTDPFHYTLGLCEREAYIRPLA